jgi:hypothetical protein
MPRNCVAGLQQLAHRPAGFGTIRARVHWCGVRGAKRKCAAPAGRKRAIRTGAERKERKMKKLLLASVAVMALGATTPSFAQMSSDNADGGAAIGGTAGAATGAGVGFLLGGPIGAVIGGFTGAVIGAEAGIEATTVEYAAANPVEPIIVDGGVEVGYVLPAEVTIHTVEGDPNYGYVYANNRVWIVDNNSRELVYSPGYTVTQTSADFATGNPTTSVTIEGDIAAGFVVPQDVELVAIPEDPNYSYVYINDRPALVENSSRTIVWVQ